MDIEGPITSTAVGTFMARSGENYPTNLSLLGVCLSTISIVHCSKCIVLCFLMDLL